MAIELTDSMGVEKIRVEEGESYETLSAKTDCGCVTALTDIITGRVSFCLCDRTMFVVDETDDGLGLIIGAYDYVCKLTSKGRGEVQEDFEGISPI